MVGCVVTIIQPNVNGTGLYRGGAYLPVLFEQDNAHVAFLTYSASPQEVEQVISLFEEIAIEQFWHPGDELRAYLVRCLSNPSQR